MTTSKFSVVIPTMWRYAPFVEFLAELVSCDQVDEIILINNDTACTPLAPILSHEKIKTYDFGRNIFVNPAWNFGVHVSRNDAVCILNDDLLFDLRLFDRVAAVLDQHTGVIGMCPGMTEIGQPAFTDNNIKISQWQGQNIFGFGCLMFVHKSWWIDIPDDLEIFYGDNWIFDSCTIRNRSNYTISNIDHYTPYSVTSRPLATDVLMDREYNVYLSAMTNFTQMIHPESTLKYKLLQELTGSSAIMTTSKFSVVIPTMWRYAPFVEFLAELVSCDQVDEIILINNDTACTPTAPILSHEKIKTYDFGRNIFVNPAWNFGVHVSRNDAVCILNDDISFDLRLFDRVAAVLDQHTGVIGICPGLSEFGQPAFTDGTIDVVPWKGEHTFGFGCLMFVHKFWWTDIPDGLEVYYGDNWIFDACLVRGRQNYLITNIEFYTPYASTTASVASPDEMLGTEAVLYKDSFDNFRHEIYSESALKYQLVLEHDRQQHKGITVVVATKWRHAAFLDFAQDFLQLNCVERLIIINNDESETPMHPILSSDKVTVIGHGRNVFVNPAWNEGVNASETPIVCILNDSLNFDIRLFKRVAEFFKPGMGAIGLSNGVRECGHTPVTDGMIQFEPFSGQACFGFGNLMFVRRETWRDIPKGLDIFFGDNFIFDHNYFASRVNYFVVNLFHHHADSITVQEVAELKTDPDLFEREQTIYSTVKSKIIDKTL